MGAGELKFGQRLSNLNVVEEDEDIAKYRYLSFSLGEEKYAVQLLQVREVIAVPETIPVPFTPEYFLGIMNLRGQVLSVLDLRIKIGLPHKEDQEKVAAIIIDLEPIYVAVVVDSVNSVLDLYPGDISETPKIDSRKNTDYITGVSRKGGNLNLILNIARILDVEDIVLIKEQSQAS